SVLLENVESVYLNSFCFGFRLHSFSILSPYFAQFLFRGAHIRRIISKLAQGATRYNLSKTQLLSMAFKIPSTIEEQQKIASALTTADQEIDNLRAQLSRLEKEKKALMQQLLTGKRRVKVEEAA
ncbi:MAG TPA: restriction endonuclease subunit S, partial [Agitococcus sp.]|nr:restriction endonuclease subunit S [Agitococcus sp.]